MIGLYALEYNVEMAAFADGLKAASLPFKWRNHNHFKKDETEDFSLVVVSGLRDKGREIRDAYEGLGVPVVVVDYGYLNRVHGVDDYETGHWQVGLGRLGWLPPVDCPNDRFNSLGLDVIDRKNWGNDVLICGQYSGDPSHGLTDGQMIVWAEHAIEEARIKYPDCRILWRPHPKMEKPQDVFGHDGLSAGIIDWDDVRAVYCINSTIGNEAILNGVPVDCREDATYNEIALVSDVEKRLSYFHRLAYGQWTLDEMRSGKAIRFLCNVLKGY